MAWRSTTSASGARGFDRLRVKAGHANANAPLATTLPATAGEALDDALTGHVAKAVRDTAAREVLTGKHGSPSPKRKSRRRKDSDSDSSGSPKRKSRRADSDSDSSPERSRRRRAASSDSDVSREEDSGSDIEATDKPADPRAWTVDDVAAFVLETTKQPAHAATFKRAKVNGALLMRIDAQDLEETLKIDKALDRRRLCTALDKLREGTHSTSARRHDAGLKGDKQARKALDGYIDTLG